MSPLRPEPLSDIAQLYTAGAPDVVKVTAWSRRS
jgi:hypothetical protein